MKYITAYDLVQAYRQEFGALPTVGIECTELQFYADRQGYEMPDGDDLLSVCQQLRTWQQPLSGQPSFSSEETMHIKSISCGQGAPSLFLIVMAGEGMFRQMS